MNLSQKHTLNYITTGTPHWDFFLSELRNLFIQALAKRYIPGAAFYRSIFLAISFLTNMYEIKKNVIDSLKDTLKKIREPFFHSKLDQFECLLS